MNKTVLSLSKALLALLIITSFYYCEKDSVVDSINSEASVPLEKSRIHVNKGVEVTEGIVQFLQTKSDNTFRVNFDKRNISLSTSSIAESDTNTMGIISLEKEVVVINPYNTTHTFNVITPETIDAKVNLIVIETEVHIYEYFLKYNQTSISTNNTFTGIIETFDSDGNLIGTSTVENGAITNVDGNTQPDCEDEDVIIDDSDDVTDPSPPSGSDSSVPSSNDDSTDDLPSNGSDGGEIHNPDIPCAITHYYTCNRGYSDQHQPRGQPQCSGTNPSSTINGGSILVFNDCPNMLESTTTRINPCEGDVGVILDEEELCELANDDYNSYFSSKSPFTVDLSEVRNQCSSIVIPSNAKFNCIYNKLVKSPKFKELFNNIFEDSKVLNVEFQISESIPPSNGETREPNGRCKLLNFTLDSNGNIATANMVIKINKKALTTNRNLSNIEIAKTIIHEAIHAYLTLKHRDNNVGMSLEDLNNLEFQDLLNEYYANHPDSQAQHEFMFDRMVPIIREILDDTRNDLIPSHHQQSAEALNYYNTSDPLCPLSEDHIFSWNNLYNYLSLQGLHKTEAFQEEILDNAEKKYLFYKYSETANSFSKSCNQ